MKTQIQLFYQEQRKIANANNTFLFFVENGMTREELSHLIERKPNHWKRFSNWLNKLPNK